MPVQKFKDFDSARRALWLDSGDPRIWDRFRQVYTLSRKLSPSAITLPGVRKYRSLDEAEADRQSMKSQTSQPGRPKAPPQDHRSPKP